MTRFDTVRTFAALNLDIAGARRVAEIAAQLRSRIDAPKVRWVPPTKLHVTLKFFGETDIALVPALRDEMSRLARSQPAPRLAFMDFAAFPNLEAAQVLYAETLDTNGDAAKLAAALDEAADSLGLPREERAYVPHLTLARTSAPIDLRPWFAKKEQWRVSVTVPEMVLYRSHLTAPQVEYEALGRFPLGQR